MPFIEIIMIMFLFKFNVFKLGVLNFILVMGMCLYLQGLIYVIL